ncbi:hypothetical protein [Bradyrhizobium liaoningense]|uniref:hypothetical protein n=1 Tax=Bradyrhizobium liaoningense TaxID=43992 RepID=UPI001BAA5E51|nr:hypothetical protein [Bradyrhizobium liaoningense]MBR0879526.1 hypothetical protein [Bradyrhizobium liaoningense]MBR1066923.1 hypothetical protein [Bradyrhizobium liaoningense]
MRRPAPTNSRPTPRSTGSRSLRRPRRDPGGDRLVGYAGGISPENIHGVMSVLEQTTGRYWIDMESGVRTDDRFDIEKCRAVCEAVFGGGS